MKYKSLLHEICVSLGWQGGTIQQVFSEIKKLRAAQAREGKLEVALEEARAELQIGSDWDIQEAIKLIDQALAKGGPDGQRT